MGGGPAGAACGIETARNGLETIIFEKGEHGREKVCGEGLIPDAQRALKQLGVFEEVEKRAKKISKAIIYGWKGEEIPVDMSSMTLQRKKLDQILRDEVENQGGIILYESPIKEVEIREKGVDVKDISGNSYEGDILVLATGADIKLASSLGFEFSRPEAFAVRGYIPNKEDLRDLLFWMDDELSSGYYWAFPCPGNVINVGVGNFGLEKVKLKKLLGGFVRENFDERSVLDMKGAPIRCGLREGPFYSDRVVLVGENVSTTYNLTGEGIGKAMESGMLAGEVINKIKDHYSERGLKEYCLGLEKTKGFHEAYTFALGLMSRPVKNYLFTKLLKYSSKARKTLALIVRKDADPGKVFSFRGFMKNLL